VLPFLSTPIARTATYTLSLHDALPISELRVHVAGHLREPVVPAREDGEHGAERQDVMEVRDDVIGVVQRPIHTRVGDHHTREARSEEHTSELQSREHLVCRLLLDTKNE